MTLTKYYPADYDPSNIPRCKRPKNRQWTIRTMAPFNMRCNTCGEYIYKGKKFNSRQEVAEGETYLTLKIFRFYIKCPKCVSEITFKTDPQSVDYVLEAGATRNFEALRTAELMAEKEAAEKEAELENNPMKMLENRTKASQREMDVIETLEDLRELNSKHQKVDMNELIADKVEQQRLFEEKLKQLQEEEDEAFVQSVFGKKGDHVMRRLDDSGEEDGESPRTSKQQRVDKPTDVLLEATEENSTKPVATGSLAKTSAPAKQSVTQKDSSKPVKKDSLKNNALVKPAVQAKKGLGMLVKRKESSTASGVPEKRSKPSLYEMVKKKEAAIIKLPNSSNNGKKIMESKANGLNDQKKEEGVAINKSEAAGSAVAASGLGLLGGYSDSSEGSDNE